MRIRWSIPDIIMTVISFGSLAVSTVIFFVNWAGLPQTVPTHYNALGEADGYSGKGTLIITVVVAWILVAGVFVLEFFPKLWNTGVKVTYSNHDRVYRVTKSLVVWIDMLCALLFSVCIYNSIFRISFFGIAMGTLVAAVFVVIIVFVVKLFRLRNV